MRLVSGCGRLCLHKLSHGPFEPRFCWCLVSLVLARLASEALGESRWSFSRPATRPMETPNPTRCELDLIVDLQGDVYSTTALARRFRSRSTRHQQDE